MTINLIKKNEDLDKKEETEDEKKDRIGHPKKDIYEIMKEEGLESQIEKLKEHEIDNEVFWYLTEGDFTEMIEVKIYG